jgi:hypothetical protein
VSRDTQYEEIEEEEQLLDPLLLLPDNVTPQDILEELYAIQVEKFYCNYFPSIIIPPTLPPKNMVGLGLTYFTDDSNPSPADVSPPSENTTPMTEELDLSEYECDPNVEPEEGGTTLLAQMEDILGQWNQDYGHDTWSEHGYLSLTAEEFDSYLLKDNNEYEELT